jgi:hypothetical protein
VSLDTPGLLELLLRDSGGVLVEFGAARTWGHYGERDVVYDTGTIGTERTVLIASGTITGLRERGAITVGGERYRVAQARRQEDGGLTKIHLRLPNEAV